MRRTASFFARVADPELVRRVEFYAQDVRILEDLGFEVQIATRASELRPADLFFVWWWTWAFAPVALARLVRRPVVITGTFDNWAFPGRQRAHRALMDYALAKANANIFVSRMEFEDVPRTHRVRNPAYIPHVVDTEVYRPGGVRDRTVFSLAWMQGSNAVRKCVPELVQAAQLVHAQHPELRFVIAGEKGSYFPALEALAQELGTAEYVAFPGAISLDEKLAYMRRCAVYAQPSRFEGFGLAILEAMSCGAPIVSSPAGAVPEVLGDAGLMVDGSSPEQIAAAIHRYLSEPGLAQEKSGAARGRAESLFPYERRREELRRIIGRYVELPRTTACGTAAHGGNLRVLVNALSMLPMGDGGETYLDNLLTAMAATSPEVEFIVAATPHNRAVFRAAAPNVRYHVLDLDNRSRLKRVFFEQFRLPTMARRLGVDVIFFPVNMMSARLRDIPAVVTIHDASPYFYADNFPQYWPSWHRELRAVLLRHAASRADAIISVSQFARDDIARHTGTAAEKISVIYPGTPPHEPPDGAAHYGPGQFGIPNPYVLLVGRVNKHKNFDGFVRAFADMRRRSGLAVDLVIAGAPGSGFHDLRAAMEQEKAAGFVHLTGRVGPETLAGLYRQATLFALPSLYEGFGFTPLEAMRQRVPVLLSSRASLREIGGDAAYYVDPSDREAMARAVEHLLTDAAVRERLAAAGLRQAASFGWDRAARQTVAVLRAVAGRS